MNMTRMVLLSDDTRAACFRQQQKDFEEHISMMEPSNGTQCFLSFTIRALPVPTI